MESVPTLSGPVMRIGVALATAVTLLFLRFKVMGSTLPVFTNFDNPASYEAAPAKQVRTLKETRVVRCMVNGKVIPFLCDNVLVSCYLSSVHRGRHCAPFNWTFPPPS